jgi:2-keto-3-deoxy-L-rhamnonate aldolase RhmA
MKPLSLSFVDRVQRILNDKAAHDRALLGLFACSYSSQVAEALSHSGYDFLIFDTEHCAHSLVSLHAQMMALAPTSTAAIIRVAELSPALFKQYLDLGAEALMVPNVHTAQQAGLAVSYMRYAPHGKRGVGGSVRATHYGRIKHSLESANQQAALLVQVESVEGLKNVEQISAVDGVDVVFFGPADLAADMGHFGDPTHPDVKARVVDGIKKVCKAGKVAGVMAGEQHSADYLDAGASLVALGSDIGILIAGADSLVSRVRAQQVDQA